MKRILSIILLLSLIPSFLIAADNNEEKAVERAIKNYYQNGLVRAEPKLLTKVLHEESEIYFYDKNGKVQKSDKEKFLAMFDPSKADKSIKSKILKMNVQANVASVELRIEGKELDHIDYINMIKEDGKWLITSCVSQEI